jgi:hypothetical protein
MEEWDEPEVRKFETELRRSTMTLESYLQDGPIVAHDADGKQLAIASERAGLEGAVKRDEDKFRKSSQALEKNREEF